jgi:PIN domain nuclease of toxin-antitoxin system
MRGDVVLPIEAACRAKMAFVPAVVALEIAQKWLVGKLRISGAGTAREWHEQTMLAFRPRQLPISASVALAAYGLPEPFHKDPADRLVVATGRLLDASVVTIDRRILAYGQLAMSGPSPIEPRGPVQSSPAGAASEPGPDLHWRRL